MGHGAPEAMLQDISDVPNTSSKLGVVCELDRPGDTQSRGSGKPSA